MMWGSFLRAGRGAAAAHVGRSLTRRKPYTSDILIIEAGDAFVHVGPLQMNESCTSTVHVGLSIFSFQVVWWLTSGVLPPLAPLRLLRPGLPN